MKKTCRNDNSANTPVAIFIISIYAAVFLGCSPTISPLSKATSTYISKSTPSANPPLPTRPIKVAESTASATDADDSVALLDPRTLPSGQYVVYCGFDYIDQNGFPIYSLFVLDVDGNTWGRLLHDACQSSISRDNRRVALEIVEYSEDVAYSLAIADLVSGNERKVNNSRGCMSPSWSPDGEFIVAACDNNIKALSQANSITIMVDDCMQEQAGCGSPKWSPNGEYIVYDFSRPFMGGSGVYMVETECIYDKTPCVSERIGTTPNLSEYTWSPDSEYIAAPYYPDSIAIINVKNESLDIIDLIPEALVLSIAWSPDGLFLAATADTPASSSKQVYLLDIDSAKVKEIGDSSTEKYVMFWLDIP